MWAPVAGIIKKRIVHPNLSPATLSVVSLPPWLAPAVTTQLAKFPWPVAAGCFQTSCMQCMQRPTAHLLVSCYKPL